MAKEFFALESTELLERLRESFHSIQRGVANFYTDIGATEAEVALWLTVQPGDQRLSGRGVLDVDDPYFREEWGRYLAGVVKMVQLCSNILSEGHAPDMHPVIAAWEGEVAVRRANEVLVRIHSLASSTRRERHKARAKKGAEALHGKPGGSRDKARQIQEIWANGNYRGRDICAEQECAALGWSFSTARRHLNNTPDPDPWPAKEQEQRIKRLAAAKATPRGR